MPGNEWDSEAEADEGYSPPEQTSLYGIKLAPYSRSQPRIEWRDARGEHKQIVRTKVVVGSAPGSALLIQDPTVSRLHAEMDPAENGLWVRDLGSRNGTFVDGLQVTGALVPHGGRIRLGAVELVVDYNALPQRPVEIWKEARFGRLVGGSLAMGELFAKLAHVAPRDVSVLLQGETGTGKDVIARVIHEASNRADKPFVVVDCASLPENLLDAELFGHTKGAFTGAVAARPGAIEAAEGGTVFLDEIGELPLSMQPKLLRVLESRTVRRVGEVAYRNVDVRFLSATHRDLVRLVSAGAFREDLYFRLAVLPLHVPALRERREDIASLVEHFLGQLGESAGHALTPELVAQLVDLPWPGNVRELRNFVERALALGPREALAMLVRKDSPPTAAEAPAVPDASALPTPSPAAVQFATTDPVMFEAQYRDFRESWIDAGEKEYVRRLLLRHERNVTAAAKEAGINRTYIHRLIRKHNL
jgi:transcriptional regulator with GAF, ATPase, and Fis domain